MAGTFIRTLLATPIGRLATRFRLITGDAATPWLSTIIQPVTNFDDLLRVQKTIADSKDISAAQGALVVYATVPAGKRWQVTTFRRSATTGSTEIGYKRLSQAVTTLYDYGSSGTGAAFRNDASPLILDQADVIGLETTGNVADTSIALQIVYTEEDAY